jgi:hypothetical protein
MLVRRASTFIAIGLLTAALAAPALAGNGNRGGAGGQGRTAQTQQRLRDGSCQQGRAGVGAQVRVRSQTRGADGTPVRARLRDGSCLTAPAPAAAPSE